MCNNDSVTKLPSSCTKKCIEKECKPDKYKNTKPELTTEDLQWLGKNNRKPCRSLAFKNSKFKNIPDFLLKNTKVTQLAEPEQPFKTQYEHLQEDSLSKNSVPKERTLHGTHKEANDLVRRVEVHEQQLWKQLAEMSLSCMSSKEGSLQGNLELIPREPLTISNSSVSCADQTFDDQESKSQSTMTPQSNNLSAVDNLMSLFDEEWFDNLLKAELELSLNKL